MKRFPSLLGSLLAFVLSVTGPRAVAYDLITHAQVSQRAYDESQRVRRYLEEVGIKATDFFDPVSARDALGSTDFTNFFFNSGTLRDWIGAGAIREDDFTPHLGCDRPGNPPSDIDRPLHHFFDVQRGGRGLTVLESQLGFPAPDWALGRQGRGSSLTQNQFSILDARVYQLKSLIEPRKEDRERNTALLFRTLGDVIHVLQDMAQPQHTRNDPHGGCIPEFLTGEHSWFEHYIEKRARGERFRRRGEIAPPLSFDSYPSPHFTIYEDFWRNVDQMGLADFSSRNFFSAGTNLSLFGSCGGLVEPPCRQDAYRQQDTPFSFTTVDGRTVSGTVRLFLHDVQDRLTGQIIPDVAVSSRSVWDQHLERRGFFPRFSLNTLNYDSMADVLLPRAVGYSAGLLDYFFRGKLDVDLVVDPNDPSIVELSGRYETINGTTDALVEGTLTLYADNPDGTRGQVAGPLEVKNVAPGQEISFQFKPSGEADRFIAVYEGTLGNEVKDPANGFPGGVIGKVLGGVRVESIYPDGDGRLMLRSVDGIFPLPPLAQGLELIQWGDLDNTFTGMRTDPKTGMPQVVAFRIDREVGSPIVPLVPGTDVVSARVLKQATFPSETPISLGVTVDYSQSHQFQELLISYDVFETHVWMEDSNNPGSFSYKLVSCQFQFHRAEPVVNESITFAQKFPVVLDLAHLSGPDFFFFPRPYEWRVAEVGLDAPQRLLALVEVFLTAPENNVQSVRLRARNRDGVMEDREELQFFGFFHSIGPIWAVIDVEQRKVLGVTSSESFVQKSSGGIVHTLMQRHAVREFTGGGPSDRVEDFWIDQPLEVPNPGFENVVTDTFFLPSQSPSSFELSGKLRSDLEPLAGQTFRVLSQKFESQDLYFVDPTTGTNRYIKLVGSSSFIGGSPTTLFRRPQRIPLTAGSPEILLLFDRLGVGGIMIRWSPEFPQDTRLLLDLPLEVPEHPTHTLRFTTSSAALVEFRSEVGERSTFLIDFATKKAHTFPGLLRQYVLLDPKFLYNLNDLRFHTFDLSLRPTPLPRRLAEAPVIFPPEAAYHVIRLR